MHKLLSGVMLVLGILTGIFFLYIIIMQISWKIYIKIYTNYALGLIFPYAKYKSIVFCVTIVFVLLAFAIVRVIVKSGKHHR